ncbi:MAG: TRAP transporter small permease [Deltaproteobacteria bacterium]|nr:MAG: TRAP transporter small permease [Deltaproteobacteria bacterium]UCH07710.1 MAG: TRAP transporter small permease [Deltaproteobacteria bacterium]
MLGFVRRVAKNLNRLEKSITAATGVILGLLALLVGWQVVARYLFHSGQFWAEELALVAMMWAALLGAAGCVWTDSHVRLTIIVSWIPPGVRLWILTAMDGIILWFALLIIKEGTSLVQRTMGGKMSALGIPIGITYYILPGAAVLMVLFALVKGVGRVTQYYRGQGGEP